METRTARLSVGHSGGTAGAGSRNYKVTLPTKWIERLGLGVNNREMELALDGDRIIITPRLTAEEFAENAIKHGHSVYKFSFFDGDRLCSVIYADLPKSRFVRTTTRKISSKRLLAGIPRRHGMTSGNSLRSAVFPEAGAV